MAGTGTGTEGAPGGKQEGRLSTGRCHDKTVTTALAVAVWESHDEDGNDAMLGTRIMEEKMWNEEGTDDAEWELELDYRVDRPDRGDRPLARI
jgi:hypothetical protein